jgi:methyl-accepting chemotaxis protein
MQNHTRGSTDGGTRGTGWMRKQRVRRLILFGFGAVISLMAALAAVVLVQVHRISGLEVEASRTEAVQDAGREMALAISERTAAFRDFLLSGDQVGLDSMEGAQQRYEAALGELRALVRDSVQAARRDSAAVFAELWRTEVAAPGIEMRRRADAPGGGGIGPVITFFQTGEGRRGAFRAQEVLHRFDQRAVELADTRRDDLRDSLRTVRLVTILFTLSAAALALLLASWISALIARPLARAVEFARRVASGDLTGTLEVERDDEVGELTSTLSEMSADLRETVGRVNAATIQVASAAEQISATSQSISTTVDEQARATEETSSSVEEIAAQIARVARSTESLATSVEETSSSIGEMSQSIEQTASRVDALGSSVEQSSATIEEMVASITQVGRHAEETRTIARDAASEATAGGQAVDRTRGAMERIHGDMNGLVETIEELGASGEAIGRISEIIEAIADQTNLLALNASIEAARAGEHGRGFAVVAQEIRRLAERAVDSTREIGATIRGVRSDVEVAVRSSAAMRERTEEGIELATTASATLDGIISSAGRARELMEEVSGAIQHQIQAAEQTQQAIRQIQDVAEETRLATREQAHGSRQIVEAVQNMSRQTQEVFAATSEQKRGGELILKATESISAGARSTQASVEEVVAAAEELTAESNRLAELVREFRV